MKYCPKCQTPHTLAGTFCSRSCANSRERSAEVKEKIRESVKKTYDRQGSKIKGRAGWQYTQEDRDKKRQSSLAMWDRKGRKQRSDDERKTLNKMRVMAYRARKYNATPVDADKQLIKVIYDMCPTGYEVDHIIALAEGGQHHENNLQYLPALENRKKNKTQNYDRNLVLRWQDIIK